MTTEKDLVFVSFFAKDRSAAKKSCEAILTQLKPFERRNGKFELWDRSMIRAGSNKDVAINAALGRCRVAVVLVSSEYMASEHWEREAKPLLAAAQTGQLHLLWQQISPCNCEHEEINKYQQMISNSVLTNCSPAVRAQHEQKISEVVFQTWNEFAPLAQRLQALPIDLPVPSAITPAPLRTACDAIALVLTPSGEEKEAEYCYQWGAFIQKAGDDQFQQIPNGAIGAEPTYPKNSLEALLQCLKCWIDSELADEPVLEIYAPDILLDEDWGSISTQAGEEPKPLHIYQPFLLRSSDRLLNRQWNNRQGALQRMHHHLVEGTGAWLPQDQLTKTSSLETLDGKTHDKDAGDAVISAICLLQPNILKHKVTWLRSVLKSMAPLVVWPSPKSTLGENQIQHCLRNMSLIRDDTNKDSKVERPHCPDLVRLAKARQKWNHPEVDLGSLTILVDHPDRAPDRTMLQALFSPSRQDSSSAPPGERSGHQPALLISS
jgi:hypothetical protein